MPNVSLPLPPATLQGEDTPPPAAVEKFKTSLKLSEERERWLVDRAIKRMKELIAESGRDDDGRTRSGSFLDIRRINQLSHDGDFEWRKQRWGGVFLDSNFTKGTQKRYVRHLSSKITDDLLGTSPFFAAMSRRDTEKESQRLIKSVESFVQAEVDRSPLPDVLREACTLALVRNEAIVKLRYTVNSTGFVGPAKVMVGLDGTPVRTPGKGLYIFENDNFVPHPAVENAVILEKDPSFTVDATQLPALQFTQIEELPQTSVAYEGLDASVLDYRDFICPLTVDSIHDADLNAHLYDRTPEQLAVDYKGFEVSTQYFSTTQTSAESSPNASHGEAKATSEVMRWVPVAECYIRCDANDDGVEEEIFLIIDVKAEKPIFYDYLYNHMKKRPFEVIHGLHKVPGRWYGVGVYTDTLDQSTYIDAQFNRINIKDSKTGSVTAIDKEQIVEWAHNLPVEIGGPEILTFSQKWKGTERPFIQRINLTEVSQEGLELMGSMQQASDQQFGVISAGDASAADLNQSKTATGISNLERSSNSVTKAAERIHMKGIVAALQQAVDIILENMDAATMVTTKEQELLTLNRDEIRHLERDVKLLLSRSRSTEMLATNQQAEGIVLRFLAMDPIKRKAVRDFYLNMLKALEVQDADEILPEVTDDEIKAFQQSQGAAQEKPPSENISIKYDLLQRSEQEQILQRAGIQPAKIEPVMPAAPSQPMQPGQPNPQMSPAVQ